MYPPPVQVHKKNNTANQNHQTASQSTPSSSSHILTPSLRIQHSADIDSMKNHTINSDCRIMKFEILWWAAIRKRASSTWAAPVRLFPDPMLSRIEILFIAFLSHLSQAHSSCYTNKEGKRICVQDSSSSIPSYIYIIGTALQKFSLLAVNLINC